MPQFLRRHKINSDQFAVAVIIKRADVLAKLALVVTGKRMTAPGTTVTIQAPIVKLSVAPAIVFIITD